MEAPPPIPPPPPATPDFHDRRGGLVAFGIIGILLGVLWLLMLPFTLLGRLLGAQGGGPPLDAMTVTPALLTFALLATTAIWLGIGSIQCRRWARALTLCAAWIALVSGAISVTGMALNAGVMRDAMMQQAGQGLPRLGATFLVAFTLVMTAALSVVGPAVAVLFYRSPHVRRTCEVRDPQPRWTDRCPLPVLAMCLLQVVAALYLACLPQAGRAIPFGHGFITGWPARVAWVGMIGLLVYAARGFYRLDRRAWTVYIVAMALVGGGTLAAFAHLDVIDYYRAIGMSEAYVAWMAKNAWAQGGSPLWTYVASTVVVFGYLLYLRRYFTRTPATDRLP